MQSELNVKICLHQIYLLFLPSHLKQTEEITREVIIIFHTLQKKTLLHSREKLQLHILHNIYTVDISQICLLNSYYYTKQSYSIYFHTQNTK